jgi:class 3 adenylate cyclase
MTVSLAAFVPSGLLARITADARGHQHAHGVVLTADLEGFTDLTEALGARHGADGGEQVSVALNHAFDAATAAVAGQGGHIVKFLGDGVVCLFFDDDGRAQERADSAAVAIATLSVTGPTGRVHRFRVGVAAGPFTLHVWGGHHDRFELFAAGESVDRALRLAASGPAGEVRRGQPGLVEAIATTSAAWQLDPESLLPPFVRARVTAGALSWLAEFRTLTLLFVRCARGLCPEPGASGNMRARSLQNICDAHGGELLRFNGEGDDLIAEVAFGIAGLRAAATGAGHAVACAIALREEEGLAAECGIATGRVLFGPIGGRDRLQVTSMGRTVNLAARLMQSGSDARISVDEPTWQALRRRFEGTPALVTLKGIGEVRRYAITREVELAATTGPIIGRESEQALLLGCFEDERPTPVVIEGEAGIGKSRLASWLLDVLPTRGIAVALAAASPLTRDVPFGGIRAAMRTLCGLEGPALADVEAHLASLAADALGDAALAPLLGDLTGSPLPDTPFTRGLQGTVRADNLKDVTTALCRHRARQGRLCLIVEDAHWLDASSRGLLERIHQTAPEVGLVVLTRPVPDEDGLGPLSGALGASPVVLTLEPLDEASTADIALSSAGGEPLPDALQRWIYSRSKGNPFFAQELAELLRERGVARAMTLSGDVAALLESLPTAPTIESTVEQRIEALGPGDGLVVRAASVFSGAFTAGDLAIVAQDAGGLADLGAALSRITRANLTVRDGGDTFRFRHRYTHEAAYRMLPRERRHLLHRRVAEAFEAGARGEDPVKADGATLSFAAEVAHHWLGAEDEPRAVVWIEKAGELALHQGADREAATYFRKALAIAPSAPAGRLAAWRRQLGRAMFGLGEVERVMDEVTTALALVGRRVPRSALGWLWFTATRALRRLLPVRARQGLDDAVRRAALEGARAAGLLAESAYFRNAPEAMVGGALLAVDIAERIRSDEPVAVAYGMLGVVCGMARLRGTAERYLERARRSSLEAGDPLQQGVAWFYTGLYYGCLGDWERSREAADRALEQTLPIRADTQSGFQYTLIASNALFTSDYDDTRRWMAEVELMATRAGNVQQQGWCCNVVGVAELHQAHYDDAIALTRRSRALFLAERDTVSLIIAEGVLSNALARAGRLDEALTIADELSARFEHARPTTWGQLEGFAGPCEVYVGLLQRGELARVRPGALSRALSRLRQFAWIFPYGRARLASVEGWLALTRGRPGVARSKGLRALEIARRFRMPYEELRALEVLAAGADASERARLTAELEAASARVRRSAQLERADAGSQTTVASRRSNTR